eukprot:403372181
MSVNDKDLQDMVDWGITMVRLGVMWESVEVAPQRYNMTYLNEVNNLINRMGEKGIYTMVDAHQDLFSRMTCGEGMPAFYATELDDHCAWNIPGQVFKLFGQCKTLDDYGIRKDPNGWRNLDDCLKTSFIKYYTSPEVASSFEGLYLNKNGIQDRFIDYWGVVAQRFANNPYVIGYDPINEPWPANFYKEFSLFYDQTKFDRTYLFPLLQRVHKAIRFYDNEKIIYFEPAQFPDTFPLFGGIPASIGFNQTPGGQEYIDRESLNDHLYCCQSDPNICDSGEPPLEKKDKCHAFHIAKVSKRAQDASRLEVPLIFTEFGACSNTLSCFHEITSSAEQFDEHLASWAYWQFKGFGDFTTTGSLTEGMYDEKGELQIYKILSLQRTFLHATQGIPTKVNFYTDAAMNGTFVAQYTLNTSISEPTEIFFNQDVYYPQDYKLSILVNNASIEGLSVDVSQKNYIKVLVKDPKFNGKTVTVVLTKKDSEMISEVTTQDKQLHASVSVQDQRKDLQGINYFIVSNIHKQGSYTFKLKDVNGHTFCESDTDYKECFTFNYLSYFVTLEVTQPGWLGQQVVLKTNLNNLNSHVVSINFSKGQTIEILQ